MLSLSNILKFDKEIKILDIGSKFTEGDPANYEKLKQRQVLGIDAFDESSSSDDRIRRVAATLGDGDYHTLHVCHMETCSSLYEPNTALMARFQSFEEWLEVTDKLLVKTQRLNDLDLPFHPDYIKSDIQGSDLMSINHGDRYYRSALVVEVEVEFIRQYKDQPLFSEVELALRNLGFQFYMFTGYGSRLMKPMAHPSNPLAPSNQWMWAHAVFVKDFELTNNYDSGTLLRYATIVHDVYDAYDFCSYILQKHDSLFDTCFAESYLRRVKPPEF